MSWMKGKPAARPSTPPHVDVMKAIEALHTMEKAGPLPPPMLYLQQQLPAVAFDRWGTPLPLSIAKQERLDRLVAVMADPYHRGRELLLSGYLDTIEASAIRDGHPQVYQALRTQVEAELAMAGPPLPVWSEGVLGVFFGRDAALVYNEGHEAEKPKAGGQYAGKPPLPTPADFSGETHLKGP